MGEAGETPFALIKASVAPGIGAMLFSLDARAAGLRVSAVATNSARRRSARSLMVCPLRIVRGGAAANDCLAIRVHGDSGRNRKPEAFLWFGIRARTSIPVFPDARRGPRSSLTSCDLG